MVDFMKWALTDGQKYCAGPRLRAAAGERSSQLEMEALEARSSCRPADDRHVEAPSSRRSADDRGFRLGTGALRALLVVLLVAGDRLWSSTGHSRLSIAKFGFEFWTATTWDPVSGEFGALPFIWGTLYSSILALLIATPIALGIAIFLSELAPRGCGTPLAFLTELLAAIPSIVYGLWGVFVLVPLVRQLEVATPAVAARRSRSSRARRSASACCAAALILAIMVIPFTSSVAREVLKAVPATQREAAYALGATRWEAIRAALCYGAHRHHRRRHARASAARSARRWP